MFSFSLECLSLIQGDKTFIVEDFISIVQKIILNNTIVISVKCRTISKQWYLYKIMLICYFVKSNLYISRKRPKEVLFHWISWNKENQNLHICITFANEMDFSRQAKYRNVAFFCVCKIQIFLHDKRFRGSVFQFSHLVLYSASASCLL